MKRTLFTLGLGVAIGYVFGTRAGRARYDQLKARAVDVWHDPRVVRARHDVEAYAKEQAPIIRERAEAVAKAAPGVAKDVAKDVAEKVSATAKDVAEKVTTTSKEVADRVGDTAATLRDRGEAAVDQAVTAAGKARDEALDVVDDENDPENDAARA